MNSIKRLREEKGMTQKELADAMGVTQQQISSYETEQTIPSTKILFKMSNFFNVNPAKLVKIKS